MAAWLELLVISPGSHNKFNNYNSTEDSLSNTQSQLRHSLITLKHLKVGETGHTRKKKREVWDKSHGMEPRAPCGSWEGEGGAESEILGHSSELTVVPGEVRWPQGKDQIQKSTSPHCPHYPHFSQC